MTSLTRRGVAAAPTMAAALLPLSHNQAAPTGFSPTPPTHANVWMFGAKGDGRDDTSALQRALDSALAGPSHKLEFPAGDYHISGPLLLHGENVVGLELVGQRIGTRIIQTADNAPIFELRATGVSHTNHFEGFTVTWARDPHRDKAKRAFLYMPPTGATDLFNSNFERITVQRGDRAFRSEGPSFWGNRCIDITVGGGSTGGFGYFMPDHNTGQPNNYFERHYIHCKGMTGSIYEARAMAAEMRAIELNSADNGVTIIRDEGGGQYNVGHLRIESATYRKPSSLFHLPNGQMWAETIELASVDCQARVDLIRANDNPRSFFDIGQVVAHVSGRGGFFIEAGQRSPAYSNDRGQISVRRLLSYR